MFFEYFNPTLVRFKLATSVGEVLTPMYFNPTLVRFKQKDEQKEKPAKEPFQSYLSPI